MRTPAVALLCVLASCASPATEPEGRAHVRTTIPAFAWLVSEIAPGADVAVVGSGDPHDLALTAEDLEELRGADIVIDVGADGFQPEVAEAAGGTVVRALEVVPPIGDPAVDPHVWQSPNALSAMAGRVAGALGELDPGSRTVFAAKAANLSTALQALAGETARALGRCARDTAVVGHEAFAYLLGPRGLQQAGVVGPVPGAGRSVDELVELVDASGLPAVLGTEGGPGDAGAVEVARRAAVPLLPIDLLTEATDEPIPSRIAANVRAFAEVLGCEGLAVPSTPIPRA